MPSFLYCRHIWIEQPLELYEDHADQVNIWQSNRLNSHIRNMKKEDSDFWTKQWVCSIRKLFLLPRKQRLCGDDICPSVWPSVGLHKKISGGACAKETPTEIWRGCKLLWKFIWSDFEGVWLNCITKQMQLQLSALSKCPYCTFLCFKCFLSENKCKWAEMWVYSLPKQEQLNF